MATVATRLGPADHGRRMTLDDFEHAETAEGLACELHRGTVTMIDVPHRPHAAVVGELRRRIEVWRTEQSRLDVFAADGGSCKIVVPATQSERHPDLALYLAPPPPDVADADLWRVWVPEIVVEVVSATSKRRDYDEKPEDYRAAGVGEYWIVDPDADLLTVLTRSPRGTGGRREIRPPETYATPLLPGFALDLASLFAAARR
jgi:Uma2 family endonuclease